MNLSSLGVGVDYRDGYIHFACPILYFHHPRSLQLSGIPDYSPSSCHTTSPRINLPSLTIVINRRDRQAFLRSRKNPDERLASLDAVSPTRTLEQWWTSTKGQMGLSEAVDGQFVWYEPSSAASKSADQLD